MTPKRIAAEEDGRRSHPGTDKNLRADESDSPDGNNQDSKEMILKRLLHAHLMVTFVAPIVP